MFYHAKVTLKPEKGKGAEKIAFEPDLTRDDLIEKIALPFTREERFFCGGVIVQPSRVEAVKFNQTEQSAHDLWNLLSARAVASGLLWVPQLSDVSSEGSDITREVLEEAKNATIPTLAAVAQTVPASAMKSNRVFVVHGHDRSAVDQTEILLHRFGLEPIILKNAPSGGRTVIEKFELHSNVGAAIVLLTPDDLGGIDVDHLAPRARQNVIWEWGYLVCRLGRPNVICLYKGGVEVPSDLHGIVTIHIADDVRDQAQEIRRELREAGYEIP